MKRVLFLMSDTGGGHRAAAEAIRDALYERYGEEEVQAELVDVLRVSRFPMNFMPEFYPWVIEHSKRSWGIGYKISNTKRRAAVLSRTMYMANAKRFKQLVQKHPVDVVVCVHSVINRPLIRAFLSLPERPPFITVVTDLVSTHMFWYDKRADRILVPTQAAHERGVKGGIPAEKMRVTGLPVHPSFMNRLVGQEKAREVLGWQQKVPTILMVAGGDGMGRIYETARAVNAQNLNCQLAIIAGRNKALKAKLEADNWNQPTHIYPFVTNMPQLMDAADIIVTKAGPATITEAGIAGLPMILMDAIPGQEEGNVDYVVEHDAGIYAPEPQRVATIIREWLSEGAESLAARADRARSISRREAVWDIVDEVMQQAERDMIRQPKSTLLERSRNLLPSTQFLGKS